MEGGSNRNVAALLVFNALRGAAVGGFMALLPMYMASIGYSMSMIGGAAAAASLAISLLLPGAGYLIDSLGSREVTALSGALIGLAPLIPALTGRLSLLAVSYALFLAAFLVGQPSRMAFLARSVSRARFGYYVGVTSTAFSASALAGPAMSGIAAERIGYQYSFIALAALATAGLGAFVALSVKPPGERVERRVGGLLEAYKRALRPSPSLAAVLGFVALDRFSWSLWAPTLTAYLYKKGFTPGVVGGLASLMRATNMALLTPAGRAVDRHGAWVWIAASEALGALGALLVGLSGGLPGVATGMALIGSSIAFWIPSYNAVIERITPRERLGEAYSVANSVRGLSGAPGPYVGGLLYDRVAEAAPFEASAAMLVTASLVAATIVRRAEARGSQELGEEPSRSRGAEAEAPGRVGAPLEGGS